MKNLRLITLNTWKGDGLYTDRLSLMQKECATHQPDILILQEALLSLDGQFNTAGYLSECVNGDWYFGPMRKKNRVIEGASKSTYSGMAMITNKAVVEVNTLNLPSTPEDGGRVGQYAVFQMEERNILVGNLHLSFLKNEDDLRIRQLEYFLSKIERLTELDHVLMGGDFNAQPESKTIKYLMHHPIWEIRDLHFTQTGAHAITFPTSSDGIKLDYWFSLANKQIQHPKVNNAQICFHQPDEKGTLASDHFGVLIDIEIEA